jgi:ATP-dependent Clp protease ATP-binding subunit ClpB
MRFDKFTTKFQQALADAQSLAVGRPPVHRAAASAAGLLNQDDGSRLRPCCSAPVPMSPALKASLAKALERLPKVEGHGGEVSIGRDLANLLNLTDKEAQKRGDQFIASEMFLLALTQTTRASAAAC